jgi:hypothetical protein
LFNTYAISWRVSRRAVLVEVLLAVAVLVGVLLAVAVLVGVLVAVAVNHTDG